MFRPTAVLQALRNVIWPTASKAFNTPQKQTAAEARIQRHVALKEQAKHNKFQGPVDAQPRDTYFHGEGGVSDPNGTAADGHITVDFFDENGTFLTTHHVYKDDAGYFKK